MAGSDRTVVIDLGSNSFRLVVFSVTDGVWRRTDEIYENVRIGQGLNASGRLGKKPMRRALEVLDVFAHFCEASGIDMADTLPVATSAIRDATNQAEFLHAARELTGMEIRVLEREEEARYGYLAAVNSTTLADGAVLDLGGGSMQLVEVAGRHERHLGSWPLGAVRMTEAFLPDDGPAGKKARKALRNHVIRTLQEEAGWLERCGRLVGIGGTVRNLASAVQHEAKLPANGVQAFRLERDALDDLVDRLADMDPCDRGGVKGIKEGRADIILAGALVVQAVLEHGGLDAIEVTEAGLREGVFFAAHLDGDPPLFEDVRRQSVVNLAGRYLVETTHTEHVATLSLGLFDALAEAGLHEGDAMERELLWAASTLHDIGMSIDYDDHHKHTKYLVLNAGLPGFEPREVALIAQAARYHRKGSPDFGDQSALAADGDDARLDRLATLLRLAEDLERSRDQSVRAVDVLAQDGTVLLELHTDTDGAASVARWAAERETELFKRAFGTRLKVASSAP